MTAQTRSTVTDPAPVIEALFAEARRRRRRIRLTGSGVVLLAAVALALGLTFFGPGAGGHHGSPGPAGGQAAARANRDPRLVWVTSDNRVIIGDLRTLTSRSVGEADVAWPAPLVPAGGLIYWVNASGGYVDGAEWPQVIEALNPRTGTSTIVSPGEYIFPSADGHHVYAALGGEWLALLPPRPGLPPKQLTLPRGWYLPGGAGLSVANGITVQSTDAPTPSRPAELAVWNPRTGEVRPIGRAEGAIAAYTPRGADYSLLAWMPARCRFPSCPITITNTATLASRTLHSPLGYGFVMGGAFSPNGQQLATFVNVSGQAGGEAAELAIASTATGTIRVVPQVKMTVGEDADWVRWLPGGRTLVAEGYRDYLVNAATLAARPFHFTPIRYGVYIDYSAELIP